jgi:signal transduction histidine kinase
MHILLSDLLELSRVGRIINPPEEVDLAQVIREAIETLDANLRSKKVVINSPLDMPMVYGDRVRLREVFENLIDNATKYTGDQPNPMIEIGTKDEENEVVFFVRDNGLGIELQYQKKVFGLFDKLNPNSEGSGIGLALIKRIIETHGGKIWVESPGLGKGSMFCFTIPDSRHMK